MPTRAPFPSIPLQEIQVQKESVAEAQANGVSAEGLQAWGS